jgi:hypothetical protein
MALQLLLDVLAGWCVYGVIGGCIQSKVKNMRCATSSLVHTDSVSGVHSHMGAHSSNPEITGILR